ncbi:MAG: glycosyltransferase family 4 protein [Chloroflexi bacterium]|nr:glycosyltransferase family 4 protein [Chloroflexota bacterium]
MSRPAIALVTPWYGADITGGAETVCRGLAEHLAHAGHAVEVLTTCAWRFQSDWGKNHHRPGLETLNGVPVRRFRVRPRDGQAFHQVNLRLMRGLGISTADEQQFMQHIIGSDELVAYIGEHRDAYRFVFLPYMFGTSYWGARAAPENSLMMPCLHDEAYAHMAAFRALMPSLRGFLLLSQPERDLMQSLYGIPAERLHLIGAGVDAAAGANPARFREKHRLAGPYIVYVGRRDETKNTPLLLDHFRRMKLEQGGDLKLVLIGPGGMPAAAARPDVIDLGVTDEQTKHDALAGALCLVNPSLNESFSLVLMEAWLAGRPVLVHAGCAVTVGHCRAGHGGLFFANYAEFSGALRWLSEHPTEAAAMGAQGARYVRANFTWERVLAKMLRAVYGEAAG